MPQEIKTINLPLPFGMGSVNCYLVEVAIGYILIDTGCSSRRAKLEKELENTGCQAGSLKLIILTHGDFDHTGNAAYLSKKFGARIAMHRDDAGMVELGDMFWNRKKRSMLVTKVAGILFRFGKSNRFSPDLYVEDRDEVSEHGLGAKVIHIPGHSKGSIGVITASGDLICGDLLTNGDKPALTSIVDDLVAAKASVEKLKSLRINTVYPGHGKPFPMEVFIKNNG